MSLPNEKQYDVVIVGAGASGFSAALEAADQGLKVLVLEKGRKTGGSGNYMDGAFAVNSTIQKEAGERLSKKAVLEEALSYTHYQADARIWKRYIDQSAANIDWLLSMGVKFEGVLPIGHGAHTMHLYTGQGYQVIHGTLEPRALAAGAEVVTSVSAKQIQINGKGVVTGVKVEDFETKEVVTIQANAVILATGGYLNNDSLIHLNTNYSNNLIPVNSGKNTGDGLQLAWEVGASHYRMGTAMLFGGQIKDDTKPAYLNWQNQLNGAATQQGLLLVNQTGQRFMNEAAPLDNFAESGNALFTQSKVYSILDQATVDRLQNDSILRKMGTWDYKENKLPQLQELIDSAIDEQRQFAHRAETIKALADLVGLPELETAVTRYNRAAALGKDDDFYKDAKYLLPVTQAPYYAFELGVAAYCTLGGLQVDLNNAVLNADGLPIKGVYAAGNDAAGCLTGDTYSVNFPGTASGYTFYSGRNAAQSVVNDLK